MSERDSYVHGVPCWIELAAPDPHSVTEFYAALFDWSFRDSVDGQIVATLRGRDVAGISPLGQGVDAGWRTHIRVDDADRTVEAALAAGGSVVRDTETIDSAGRTAVLVDPTGVQFSVWEPRSRYGAGIVDEANSWALSSLHSADPDASAEFYNELFGWEFSRYGASSASALISLPGYVGGVPNQPVPRDVVAVMAPPADNVTYPDRAGWSVDFFSDDPDAVAALTPSLGGSVIRGAHDSSIFRTAVIADPSGAAFSVSRLDS